MNKLNIVFIKVTKFFAYLVLVFGTGTLIILSLVDEFDFIPDLKTITTVAALGIVINYLIWDSFHKTNYDTVLNDDKVSAKSIHKLYDDARSGWKEKVLRQQIQDYNNECQAAFINDCEQLLARTHTDIVNGRYKGNKHWIIIWKLKYKKYPKTGIKRPRDLLNILRLTNSNSYKINLKLSEQHHAAGRIKKIVTSTLVMVFAAAIVVVFLDNVNIKDAIIKIITTVGSAFVSAVMGSYQGHKNGLQKLSTAEEVAEKLIEWKKNLNITDIKEEPIKEEPIKEESKVVKPEIIIE